MNLAEYIVVSRKTNFPKFFKKKVMDMKYIVKRR